MTDAEGSMSPYENEMEMPGMPIFADQILSTSYISDKKAAIEYSQQFLG